MIAVFLACLVALAFGETEQIGPGVTGAYGGIVAQVQPQVYYNATFTMAPTGQGQAAFFNPALGFKCLGAVKFFQGTSYSASQTHTFARTKSFFFLRFFVLFSAYNLQVDHSSVSGACALCKKTGPR
jgi:hypothetical protein